MDETAISNAARQSGLAIESSSQEKKLNRMMMSDHWKAIARILGAPGGADPPKPEPAKPEPPKVVPPKSEVPKDSVPPSEAAPVAVPNPLDELARPAPKTPTAAEELFRTRQTIESAKLPSLDDEQEGPGASWDSLLKEIGVDEGQRSARPAASVPAASPDSSAASARKPAREQEPRQAKRRPSAGGFASGLGADDDSPAPPTVSDQSSEVREESADDDPLASLGEFGWGAPRRRGPAGKGSTGGSDDFEQSERTAPARSGKREEPSRPEEVEVRDEAQNQDDRGRRQRGGRSGRPERSQRGERQGRGERPERGERQGRGERPERAESGRGGRTSAFADDVEDASDIGSERESAPAAEGSSGGAPTQRSSRRGRRRGERQRIGEELSTWEEELDELPAESIGRPESSLSVGEPSTEYVTGGSEEADADDDDEAAPRRRRRRGRRRRGGGEGDAEIRREGQESRHQESRTPGFGEIADDADDQQPATRGADGRAIDAHFDDDFEDDDEAVALRKSRRRRRSSSDRAAVDRAVVQTAGGVDEVLEDEDSPASYNTQRNVPTWLEAVDLLVVPNMESRKRDPRRGSGGGSGTSSGGGGGRPRGRR